MMEPLNPIYTSIEQVTGVIAAKQQTTARQVSANTESFAAVLAKKQLHPLVFSKHANERLQSRNIALSQTQLERLASGTKIAGDKGIKDSLVMVDNLAFIVNVPNKTVVTAVNDGSDKVFTNIDGAVII
jgi:flagellar operon protein